MNDKLVSSDQLAKLIAEHTPTDQDALEDAITEAQINQAIQIKSLRESLIDPDKLYEIDGLKRKEMIELFKKKPFSYYMAAKLGEDPHQILVEEFGETNSISGMKKYEGMYTNSIWLALRNHALALGVFGGLAGYVAHIPKSFEILGALQVTSIVTAPFRRRKDFNKIDEEQAASYKSAMRAELKNPSERTKVLLQGMNQKTLKAPDIE